MGKETIENPALKDLEKITFQGGDGWISEGWHDGVEVDCGTRCLYWRQIPANFSESWPRYQVSESIRDNARRFEAIRPWLDDAKVIDFGAGHCGFEQYCLNRTNATIYSVDESLYELQHIRTIQDVVKKHGKPDLVVAWQVFEHLESPLQTLAEIREALTDGGRIVIETPNANDWLLHNCEAFREFSLTPKHLILHTRESLRRFLEHAGFRNIKILGIQRYGFANHLNWLVDGKPRGHADLLEWIDDDLDRQYERMLGRQDSTDTLWATAEK